MLDDEFTASLIKLVHVRVFGVFLEVSPRRRLPLQSHSYGNQLCMYSGI